MTTPGAVSQWMVKYPVLARARLLTASRELAKAALEVGQMIGYLDGKAPTSRYLELGITEIQSALLHAVHALDVPSKERG